MEKLVNIKDSVYTENGHLVCSFAPTPRQKEILYGKDRLDGETWLNYRVRSEKEYINEDRKRENMARLFCREWNKTDIDL